MAWYDSVVGVVSKHVLPAVASYGGKVVGGAVGMVVGGPVGAVAGATAGGMATDAIKGALKGEKRRAPARTAAPRAASSGGRRRRRKRSRSSGLSRGRHKVHVSDARIVFTVDGDGKVTRKVRRRRKRLTSKVPAMVIPEGSQKGDALAVAGRLIASTQSADPRLSTYAKAVMNATARRARAGDKKAKRAVSLLKTAQSANQSKSRLTGFLVTNSGRVLIGSFLQTG